MQLPADLIRYLASGEYDQGTMMLARRDSVFDILQNAKDVMTQNPYTQSKATWDLYKENVERFKVLQANVGGVCQCLAVKWCKLKIKERAQGLKGSSKVTPDARMLKLKQDRTLDKAATRQSASGQKIFYTAAFEEVLKLYNVTPADPRWDKRQTIKELCAGVVGKVHACFVIGIDAPKLGGNHALGLYTTGGKLGQKRHVHVFDPNYGELRFPVNEFPKLFAQLLASCYKTPDNGILVAARMDT